MRTPGGNEIETQFEFLALCAQNVSGYIVVGFDFDPKTSKREGVQPTSTGYLESTGGYNNVFLCWPQNISGKINFVMTKKQSEQFIILAKKKFPDTHYESFKINRE